MIPVDQTRFGHTAPLTEAPGNCFAACIASILELRLDQVPDESANWKEGMTHDDSWPLYFNAISIWLRERGYFYIEVPTPQLYIQAASWKEFDVYNIIAGPSPRNPEIYHAVVGKGVKLVHDPHPSRDYILSIDGKPWYFGFLLPIDASKMSYMG